MTLAVNLAVRQILAPAPVDAVKVDKTFVDGLGTDPHDSALVSAILAMADALELAAAALPTGPGLYLARPMPAAESSLLVAGSHHWPVD